jgi:choline dehydrogenase-like flavoprotein
VIGSGPAGTACAHALVERGLRPLVVDGGRRLDRDRAAVDFAVDFDALPLKPSFGSLYPYAIDEPLAPLRANGVGVVPSLGRGGLSSVWGAAMLPFEERQLAAWPVAAAELADHYRRVLRFVPIAGERDALEERFPLFVDRPQRLPATPQIASLMRDLRSGHLGAAGVLAGRSRLAVWTSRNPHGEPCREVGLCMVGCPYGAIYNSAVSLAELERAGALEYRPGVFVEALEERAAGVRLRLRSLVDGTPSQLDAARVFVGAGALATTRLLLRSLEAFDRAATLLDNTFFTFPILRWRRGGRVGPRRAGMTLAQAFLEIDDVHLQLYGYNDLMLQALARRTRLPERVCDRLFQPLLGRLLYAQGYLHSDVSARIELLLRRDGTLVAEAGAGPDPAPAVAAVLGRLRELRGLLRFEPLAPLLRIWTHGRGFHVGGSFPMSHRPDGFESDALGRPVGFRRVHVVDAAVFPTLPPTTITLSIMANGHRIGTRFDED